jgi:mRNA deadenylase 3'-5' endonuclease subunit Ccr4
MSILISSYNILADAYIRSAYYPNISPEALEPARRGTALLDHLQQLAADILCLQEVEPERFASLCARFADSQARFAPKAGGKPDGCASLVAPRFPVQETRSLYYAEGTGQLALLTVVEVEGRRLGIANTHLSWDPPETPIPKQVGRSQLVELLDEVERFTPRCQGWILCGDFNASPDSARIVAASQRGFRDPYAGLRAETCNANRVAKRIDYLLHSPSLTCVPQLLPPIDGETPLPSLHEPSDHLAIGGSFAWRPA